MDQQGDIDFPDGNPNVAKMTAEQWRSHVLQDHVPFSRECTTCLKGAGRSDAMTLSVDICGPFRPAEKAKYFLGGLCHSKVMEEPPEQPGDAVLLPEAEPEEIPGDEGDPKVLEEWERLEVESEDVAVMISYTMVDTLTSRHATELRAGLARMLARLKYLGMEVRRVHSDGAGEMRGTRRWCEARGLYRTFTKWASSAGASTR